MLEYSILDAYVNVESSDESEEIWVGFGMLFAACMNIVESVVKFAHKYQ